MNSGHGSGTVDSIRSTAENVAPSVLPWKGLLTPQDSSLGAWEGSFQVHPSSFRCLPFISFSPPPLLYKTVNRMQITKTLLGINFIAFLWPSLNRHERAMVSFLGKKKPTRNEKISYKLCQTKDIAWKTASWRSYPRGLLCRSLTSSSTGIVIVQTASLNTQVPENPDTFEDRGFSYPLPPHLLPSFSFSLSCSFKFVLKTYLILRSQIPFLVFVIYSLVDCPSVFPSMKWV